ncbi:MAG: hypothetical protein Q9163_003951 [Psora crenata]
MHLSHNARWRLIPRVPAGDMNAHTQFRSAGAPKQRHHSSTVQNPLRVHPSGRTHTVKSDLHETDQKSLTSQCYGQIMPQSMPVPGSLSSEGTTRFPTAIHCLIYYTCSALVVGAPRTSRYVQNLHQPPATMPIYLVHGFRWPRKAIRIHVILHNVEDAAPDYTMSTSSNRAMISSLQRLYPHLLDDLPNLQMVEEYDPNDESASSSVREYAYLADKVVKHNTCIDVKEVQDQGIAAGQWGAMADLREEVAKGEKLGWWVVFNGDPERGNGDADMGGNGDRMMVEDRVEDRVELREEQEKKGKGTVRNWFKKGTKE